MIADEHRIDAWRLLYDSLYSTSGPIQEYVGWRSSFTGQQIPADEMAEWRIATVRSIRRLTPRRILEIGVGTGMICTDVAPWCDSYIATDVSEAAIAAISGPRDQLPGNVELLQMEAADAVELTRRGVDLVVLNSVIQYFPSVRYLSWIVDRALELLEDGGRVFLGDIRDLRSADMFRLMVARCSLPDGAAENDIRATAAKLEEAERELLVHPDFFAGILRSTAHVSQVDIRLKRGRATNEMNAFRYDVVVERGRRADQPTAIDTARWHDDIADLEALRGVLTHTSRDALRVVDVPNGRFAHGVNPEDLYRVGDDTGYDPAVTWSTTSLSRVDVIYRRPPCPCLVSAYQPTVLASPVANVPA